jgi:hypothetical protein
MHNIYVTTNPSFVKKYFIFYYTIENISYAYCLARVFY